MALPRDIPARNAEDYRIHSALAWTIPTVVGIIAILLALPAIDSTPVALLVVAALALAAQGGAVVAILRVRRRFRATPTAEVSGDACDGEVIDHDPHA